MIPALLVVGLLAAASVDAAPADTTVRATVDTVARVTADTAVTLTTRAPQAPRRAGAPAPEPPYRIQADRMSGGRGPEGDVLFLEQVSITRGRTRLRSLRGRYERATGMIHLEGDVRLRDSSTTVTCQIASFSETEDRLDLSGDVVVKDGESTLRAPLGWYDRRRGFAQLTGGVTGQERRQRLSADEATYQRDSMIVRARGRVVGIDEENRTRLEARAVDFDRRSHVAVATGEPRLRATDDDGKETVLHARLLRVDSEAKVAEAIDSVLVERDTLRARADRATFDDRAGTGLLLGSPRAWDGETQVVGDTLETHAVDRRLERVIVRGRATLDYLGTREGSRGETSRLTGDRVDLWVTESRIDSILAVGKPRNEYRSAARNGRTAERNSAEGDSILVFFRDRKIDRARVLGTAKGEYRPPVAVDDTAAARAERVIYDARRIDFDIPRDRIVLDGDAHLDYQQLQLSSRRVTFDSGKNTLVAEGKPQLIEKGDEVTGQLMTYDMDRRVGTIYQATTAYEQGLYHGQRIRKASDDELDVLGGSYSTCDLDQPHYHFSARYMKIYLKDKLVARPVVFYLRNVPILALPFYVFPIKPGRHSGFLFPQFEFGFNSTGGQFLRNAGYYWAPNDYMDFTAAADYYQADPSFLLRGDMNYKLLYSFDGHLEGEFRRDEGTGREDYRFYGTHQQTIGQRTRLSALGNFVSSRDYNGSVFSGGTLEQRLNRFLTSSLQLSHYADWISLNAVADRRQDLDADRSLLDTDGEGVRPGVSAGTRSPTPNLTATAPSLSVTLPTRALGSYGFAKDSRIGKALSTTYLSLSARFLSLYRRTGVVREQFDDLGNSLGLELEQDPEVRRAASTTFSLSDSRRLFGWINFSPSLFGNAVMFDRDNRGQKLASAAVYQAGAGLGTTLYRTVSTPVKPLALRHVLSPNLSLGWSPDFPGLQYTDAFGFRRDRFTSVGDIGLFSARRSLRTTWSIEQRLQAKWTRGDKVHRLDNLLSWSTAGTIDHLWKQNPSSRADGRRVPFGPIASQLRLQPPGYVNLDATAGIDPYSGRPLQQFAYNVSASFNNRGGGKPQAARLPTDTPRAIESDSDFRENWSASIAYSYAGGYSGPSWRSSEQLNGVLRYALTENWTFDYQAGYDMTRRQVLLQRYNLTRRIHCWDATFSRSFIPGGETEYYFRLGIRDQKEIYLERGTRVQSFGGIQ